jgi:hypothetical protein
MIGHENLVEGDYGSMRRRKKRRRRRRKRRRNGVGAYPNLHS